MKTPSPALEMMLKHPHIGSYGALSRLVRVHAPQWQYVATAEEAAGVFSGPKRVASR
jgi:hypothetical protein